MSAGWQALLSLLILLTGCSMLKEREPNEVDPVALASKPLPPEKAEEVLDQAAGDFIYGQGVGDAALTAGAVVAFPPYLAVVLGNAALSLSGYEPITVSGMLPDEAGELWRKGYDGVASSPGRVSAAIAGKEYRTDEVIKDDMRKLLDENGSQSSPKVKSSEDPLATSRE